MTGRGLLGRRFARFLLVVAVLPGVIAAFLIVADPPTMGGGRWHGPPGDIRTPILAIGAAMYLVGVGLMIRFYRATFEPSRSSFRATRR